MSLRQRRLAHVTGLVTLALSLAAVTSTMSARNPQAAATATDAHVFVPTRVALPTRDEEAAPTF